MKNNNPNDYLQEDEIDLKEIFKLLINSKKLIIVITLVITTLGAIYSFQKAPQYKSTALLEIVQYDTLEKVNILVEPASKLIQNLNIVFIHKSFDNKTLSIKTIEDKLIEIEIHKPSIDLGKKTLDEITRYIEKRHSLLLTNVKNQLKYRINSLNKTIEYHLALRSNQIKNDKLRITNKIESLNSELPVLDKKIESLSEVIVADEKNLLLLESDNELFIQRASQAPTLDQVIFTYKADLIDYENQKIKVLLQKNVLETQLKALESNVLESTEILESSKQKGNFENQLKALEGNNLEYEKVFELVQQKDRLDLELEFLLQQTPTSTQLIGEIVTNPVKSRIELIIFLSFMLGLFLSIVVVFINNSLQELLIRSKSNNLD
jgi:LPS O-antigen subunit length determinant protein (WzzB/FepE family)